MSYTDWDSRWVYQRFDRMEVVGYSEGTWEAIALCNQRLLHLLRKLDTDVQVNMDTSGSPPTATVL